MDFTALKTALTDGSFDDLSTAQQGLLINDAVREVDESARWPYREATSTGAAPLTIADLGEIDTVLDATTSLPLMPTSRGEVVRGAGDVTLAGQPSYWYRDTLSGTLKVTTYPVTTGNITVRYYKTPATLSAGADTPGAPARWHSIYVAVARREAFRRFRGDPVAAQAEQVFINAEISSMRASLLIDAGQVESRMDGVDC